MLVNYNEIYYLLDVAGYVTNVGRLNYMKTGQKNLDFYLQNKRLIWLFFTHYVVNLMILLE